MVSEGAVPSSGPNAHSTSYPSGRVCGVGSTPSAVANRTATSSDTVESDRYT